MKHRVHCLIACALLANCTKPNPKSCADGTCEDPEFAFCDVDGSFDGIPNTCIAVECEPMAFAECRGNFAFTCNSLGNSFDVVECEDRCDEQVGCTETRVPFIVFVTNRDGNNEIYRMGVDGSMPTNLTRSPSHEETPVWDPTGNRIAFLSDRNGPLEVFAMAADGTDVVSVSKGEASVFAWSPDGQSLTFTSKRGGTTELFRAARDGTSIIPLTNLGSVEDSDWSPDGSKIAFVASGRIHTIDPDGANLTPLTTGSDFHPRWRPDGSKIAFTRRITFSDFEVFLVNSDGSSPQNISQAPDTSEVDVVWSLNGQFLTGTGGLDPDTEVYVVDTAGTNLDNISLSSARDRSPCWSPDGETIVYTSERDGNTELYSVARIGGTSVNLTNSSSSDFQCSWRPR